MTIYFLQAAGPKATVFDDGADGLLIGGSVRDWYFARLKSRKGMPSSTLR